MEKVCLIIIDGFGISSNGGIGDATAIAKHMKMLKEKYPFFRLNAHGKYVGLPENSMGNSEVGHMTIGAGRIVDQILLKINKAYLNGEFAKRMDEIKLTKRVHLIGLLSNGGVHSHINHLKYLLEFIPNDKSTFVHAIADGRDTGPKELEKYLKQIDSIVSVAGRYYTMDRDNNEERIEMAFKMMTEGTARELNLERIYDSGTSDEFIEPILIKQETIHKEDTLIFFNIRADRMRQIVKRFSEYPNIFTLADYGIDVGEVLFYQSKVENPLSEWLSKKNITQAHIAETDKYAHVTYFLNGGEEKEYDLETRIMVPSLKVQSFDKAPKTSMAAVADNCIKMMKTSISFIVLNFAGPDLVGHTGNYQKTLEAVKEADEQVHRIYLECLGNGYTLLITADHGNSELMFDENDIVKKHTANQVPLFIVNSNHTFVDETEHALYNVAPTILDLMNLEIPSEMTGKSLIKK